MAAFNKFEKFVLHLASGEHNLAAAGDMLKAYLTNNAPSASGDTLKADLAGIAEGSGYAETDIQNDVSESGGVLSLTGVDITITASGGNVGPFRYVVLYNDTPTSPADPLIGWWDYGTAITILVGETFTVDFDGSNGILTVA